jgi:outer membrane protein assembly factor BamB
MEDYTHYRFNPERCRRHADPLAPPLTQLKAWSMTGVAAMPKVASGRVFVNFLDGRVEAYGEHNKQREWSFGPPENYRPGIPDDGDLLISGNTLVTRLGGDLFVLDAVSGNLESRHRIPSIDLLSSLVREKTLFGIYVDEESPEEPTYCFAYELHRQKFLWKQEIERIPKWLTASDQSLFLSDKKGHFSCLSATDGKQIWTTSVEELGAFTDVDKSLRKGDVTGVPFLWRDLVIVPIEGYRVVAFDQATGDVRWSQKLPIEDPHNLACSSDGVICVVNAETFVSVEAGSGRITAQLNIAAELRPYGGPLLTQIEVTDRHVFFSTIKKGILVALDRETGAIPWSFKCEAPVPINNAPVVVNGRLYLLDEDHTLYVFEKA